MTTLTTNETAAALSIARTKLGALAKGFPEHEDLTTGERSLYRWQYHQTSDFEEPLWQCISTADSTNLDALAKGFPEHVTAYRRYAREDGYWNNLVAKVEGRA